MKTQLGRIATATILGLGLFWTAGTAMASGPTKMNVVGTWVNVENYEKFEKPYWNETLAKNTGGAVTGQIKAVTELGLKGFEVLRLLKTGVYDYAHGLFTYVSSENPVYEGPDLASIIQSFEVQKKVADAYFPTLEKAVAKNFNAKLMQIYTFPSQVFFCRIPITGIGDLKGKKIRVFATTLGDFVEGVGGVSVTVPFGEVIPALEKGVVDCAITGTMPGYQAKWHQVATHLYTMRVGMAVSFGAVNMNKWNALGKKNQEILTADLKKMTDGMWAYNSKLDSEAVSCLSGGACSFGPPGKMVHVAPSAADLAVRDKIAADVVLPRWAKRCGKACAEDWNKTVGAVLNMKAAAK